MRWTSSRTTAPSAGCSRCRDSRPWTPAAQSACIAPSRSLHAAPTCSIAPTKKPSGSLRSGATGWSGSALLSADNLRYAYPGAGARTPVLDDVSISVERGGGRRHPGPNGSGKTTLLKMLAGVLRPDAGVGAAGWHSHRGDAAGGSRPAHRHRSAGDASGLRVHGSRDGADGSLPAPGGIRDRRARTISGLARAALAATGTARLEARSFDTLSGGEKQRVVIAAALAQAADVLLLDEPTASLDLAYQLEIAALVTRLNRERGCTLVALDARPQSRGGRVRPRWCSYGMGGRWRRDGPGTCSRATTSGARSTSMPT